MRDRDSIFGEVFIKRMEGMGIDNVVTSVRSPWQNCYVERLIGSIRRECLNRVIVLNESHLRRILKGYFDYFHHARTHLGLGKNAPVPRRRQNAREGPVIALPMVGGLHHRYERRAVA